MESQLELYGDIKKYATDYCEDALPDVMSAYNMLRDNAYKDGALSHKVKRLIALGIALRAGCTQCILHQTKLGVEAGASKAEVMEAVSVAIAMSGSTAIGWSWRVIRMLEELGKWQTD
ncbi:MAG: carboxymuconolactone decarboxylase family protein [Chloroflexi bacterium]|nr:carboxymuconolactone decarboxylase family protein [Chloroflexota bacterium]